MIQLCAATPRLTVNSLLIELEGRISCINRHGDGPHGTDCYLQSQLIAFVDVHVTSVVCTDG